MIPRGLLLISVFCQGRKYLRCPMRLWQVKLNKVLFHLFKGCESFHYRFDPQSLLNGKSDKIKGARKKLRSKDKGSTFYLSISTGRINPCVFFCKSRDLFSFALFRCSKIIVSNKSQTKRFNVKLSNLVLFTPLFF